MLVFQVRGGHYFLLAGLCQLLPELSTLYVNKITSLVLHNLDEEDPAVYTNLWEAVLSLVNYVEVMTHFHACFVCLKNKINKLLELNMPSFIWYAVLNLY